MMETPELYHQTTGFCSQFYNNQEKLTSLDSNKPSGSDHFMVEDLLDFSNEDDDNDDVVFDNITGNSTDSTITVVDSANSSSSFSVCEPCFNVVHDFGSPNFNDTSHLSSELCVPYDDLAELEWLSNFVEESFSSEDLQKLQLISGVKARAEESSEAENFQFDGNCNTANSQKAEANTAGNNNNSPIFDHEVSVPAKARTKRPRTAPCNWASRLLVLSPITSSFEPEIVVGPMNQHPKTAKISGQRRRDGGDSDGRKCLHCATDKTPQWRTGPLGPKTLCNACGVRYKSGRLVPEYRPAASPTFVLTKHSNSHRKVLELRRQKEMARAQQQQQQFFHHQNMMFDASNGDEYLIHQHVGPDFRELI